MAKIYEKINVLLESEGIAGVYSAIYKQIKKRIYTFYYRLRLKSLGRGTVFEGKVDLRGSRFIEIGEYCVIEEGASLQVTPKGKLEIGSHCFVGADTWLSAEGSLEIGAQTKILKRTEIVSAGTIKVGSRCWIARDCKIEGKQIELKDDVILGPKSALMAVDHDYDFEKGIVSKKSRGEGLPICLETGCWLGAHSIVLKGVTIGHGAIIGAGAVVTKSIGPRSVAVGNPAKSIKKV